MNSFFYIDPQSGDNLARYDYELLSRFSDKRLKYIHSNIYNFKSLSICTNYAVFTYNKKFGILKGISYCNSLIKIFNLIKKDKPSVIHIQWFRLPVIEYYFYKLLKHRYHFKLIHTVHNILPHNHVEKDFIKYGKLYMICDKLICHTKTSATDLEILFPITKNKISVIPHGIIKYEMDGQYLKKRIEELRYKYNITAKYIISILGYQSLYRGSDLVLSAWRASPLLNNNPEICLLIAGKQTGLSLDKIESDRNIVIINEKLSETDFATWLKATSLMLLPYRKIDQSGLLLSLIEEQIPYCTTEVGELTKPMEFGDIGWKFTSPSIDSVKETLEKIIGNLSELDQKKHNNEIWDKIKVQYSWDNAAKLTRELYYQLTDIN